VAYHAGSASLGTWHRGIVRRISRNQLLLVAKYYPRALLLRLAWPIVVSQTLWGLLALRHGAFGAFLRGKFEGLVLFRAARRQAGFKSIQSDWLLQVLEQSECEIHRIQRRTGFDWYWRVYFALTAGEAD